MFSFDLGVKSDTLPRKTNGCKRWDEALLRKVLSFFEIFQYVDIEVCDMLMKKSNFYDKI